MPPHVYILVPVHNRRDVTERFVRCLQRQSFTDYTLVPIDDGSTDGTAEMVCRHIPATVCLRGSGNWWWAGSLQQGFDAVDRRSGSDGAFLLIMNDDTEFGPEFVQTGVMLLAATKRSLLMATAYSLQTMQLRDRGFRVDWRSMHFTHTRAHEENQMLATRGLFLRVRDRREIGHLHSRLLPQYFSDWEWTYRAYRKGYRLLNDPRLRLVVNDRTTGHKPQDLGCEPSFAANLRQFFSRRSKPNPIYFSAFILLACPWRWKLRNIGRVWAFNLRFLFRKQA